MKNVHIISENCRIESVGEYSVCVDKDLSGYDIIALSTGRFNFYASEVVATESSSIVYFYPKIDEIFNEGQIYTALGWLNGREFLDYIHEKENI